MTLDINAGHTDFAVIDRKSKKIVAVGKFNHYETQHTKRGKREYLLHKLVDRMVLLPDILTRTWSSVSLGLKSTVHGGRIE